MKRNSTILAVLSSSLVASVAAPTFAQERPAPPAYSAEAAPFELRTGYRGSFVESPGYSPFSSNDYMPAFSLAGSAAILTSGRFAFVAGAAWDYGSTGATARGSGSSLTVHRVTAPLAVRFMIVPWLDVLATVAPGAQYQGASIEETSAVAPLVASAWVPCGDASLGVAWGFAHLNAGGVPIILRLTAEGGYAWAAPMSLAMTPDLPSNSPQRVGGTDLGTLSMNGAFGRVGVAVAF